MKCIICNKDTGTFNGKLKTHITKHHYVDELQNELVYIKSSLNITDSVLEKIKNQYLEGCTIQELIKQYNFDFSIYFKLLGIKRTNSESKKTKKYIEKYKNSIIAKYGVDNLSKSPTVKERKKKTFMKNYGYENNFCNPTIGNHARLLIDYDICQKRLEESVYKKYGVSNVAKLDFVRKKMSESAKKRIIDIPYEERLRLTEAARSNVKYTSSLELRIQDILNRNCVTYTSNKFLYSYNFDILFTNKKVLEIQGDYWHANPKQYKSDDILLGNLTAGEVWKKDNKKRLILEKNGYKVYYLWESEINNMTDDDIIKFIIKIHENS